MSRTSDFGKKNSQSSTSVSPTTSFLQTRSFAPLQTDFDEDASVSSGYSENFLGKMINQRSTKLSDTSIQTKPMNRLKAAQAKPMVLQAKLNIGEPNDKYEQEADRTAAQVVQQINSSTHAQSVQRDESMEVEEEELQMKPDISQIQRHTSMEHESEGLQMKSLVQKRENVGGGEASSDLESSITSARGGGQSLDASLQEKMGQAMGADFSGVKVHTNSQSDQLNKSIQAKAFTTGQDIFFRQGEYDPSSTGGQELLAHELTHVVQQNGNAVQRRKKVQMKPKLQRHQEEDEVQMKPQLQRHQEEDEVQMKPDLQLKESSSSCTSGCQCSSCSPSGMTVQRKISTSQTNASQNLLNRKLIDMVQQDSTQVQRFSDSAAHSTGCACSECGVGSTKIQRKSEGAHESGCSCPMCSGKGQKIQAKFEVNRTPSVSISQSSNNTPVIQRHSAYEHYMLGQVDPSELSNISMVREIPQLESQLEKITKEMEKAKLANKIDEAKTLFNKLDEAKRKKEVTRHTLEQEMNRLWAFKSNPEVLSNKDNEVGKVVKDDDDKWQVPIVKLPVKGDGKDAVAGDTSIIVSYSEINTFPDFFGNPETIANTPKSSVLGLLQGARQQAYVEMAKLFQEIFGEDKNKLGDFSNREWGKVTQGDFEGSIGPTGQSTWLGEKTTAYEKRTEMAVQGATVRNKDEEKSQEYFAALERNACHFAPYSWQQWESYHNKARDLAKLAYRQHQIAEDFNMPAKEQESLENANKALLQNAFGEHYLQDSFAAGHLIDKTGVMQAFTKWISANGDKLGSFKEAKSQWAMASMIANKQGTTNDLKSNPQALDDKLLRGEINSVSDATNEVGLGATEDIIFMMWWRNAANAKKASKHLTEKDAAKKCPIPSVKGNENKALELLEKLVTQNFAKKKTDGVIKKTNVYSLDQAQVNVLQGKGAYKATLAMELHEQGKHDFTKEAEEFNLAAYNEFMSNAYIQGATKYFHDTYCREGLEVITGAGDSIGRIYGDAKMLSGGGQKGVKYSAETSQMSREAIFNIIDGNSKAAKPVATIKNRFPTQVIIPDVGTKTLADWNSEFLYTDESFKKAASTGAKIAYKAKGGGGISGGNAINVGEIVKHDSSVF